MGILVGALEIPQHFKDFITGETAKVEARLAAEIRKVEIRGEIKGLQFLDFVGGLAAGAAHSAIAAKIEGLNNELTKLD